MSLERPISSSRLERADEDDKDIEYDKHNWYIINFIVIRSRTYTHNTLLKIIYEMNRVD